MAQGLMGNWRGQASRDLANMVPVRYGPRFLFLRLVGNQPFLEQ